MSSADFTHWEQRYAVPEYLYGTEPNAFLKAQANLLPKSGKALSVARLAVLAEFCEQKGDSESASLLGTEISAEERRYYDEGKQMLIAVATTEESQARARRAAYRTLELAGETVEPLALRKTLGKRR